MPGLRTKAASDDDTHAPFFFIFFQFILSVSGLLTLDRRAHTQINRWQVELSVELELGFGFCWVCVSFSFLLIQERTQSRVRDKQQRAQKYI